MFRSQRKQLYAVFRDSGMASDSVAANFEQIFETYSPKTQRKVFNEQVKISYWRNKLAVTMMNPTPGEQVTEIEVFEVKLTLLNLDENVLRLMD